MTVARWGRIGFVGYLLGQAACLGEAVTPLATAADFGPARAIGGWTVANSFGDVSFEEFQTGAVVIVPLRAVTKPGVEHSLKRSDFTYEVDVPNPNLGARMRYEWGTRPFDNGYGNFFWHHERLAFDLKSHTVFVLPRGGPTNVDRKQADGTQFWCNLDALRETTVAIVGYGLVCPTAFIRSTRETKGIPLLLGTQSEVYVIDSKFIAGLIADLNLDEELSRIKGAEDINRQLAAIARVQEGQQQALEAERVRTAGARGQAMIDRAELGALLCADLNLSSELSALLERLHGASTHAVVSAFLESVHGPRVQMRVNSVRSPDGSGTFNNIRIDGIDYTPGNVVWASRGDWRACE